MALDGSLFFSCAVVIHGLPCLFGHDGRNFIEVDRTVVVAIHTTIKRQSVWIIWQTPVRMAVQMPSTVMALVPNPKGVMAESQSFAVNLRLMVRVVSIVEMASVAPSQTVMVAFDEDNQAIETAEIGVKHVVFLAEAEIPQVIDQIVWFDDCVPVRNQCLVHFHAVFERAMTILDDVCVPKMGI